MELLCLENLKGALQNNQLLTQVVEQSRLVKGLAC